MGTHGKKADISQKLLGWAGQTIPGGFLKGTVPAKTMFIRVQDDGQGFLFKKLEPSFLNHNHFRYSVPLLNSIYDSLIADYLAEDRMHTVQMWLR